MAVTVAKQTTPSSVAGSGNTVTYTSVAIGASSADRIVVIAPTSEDATAGAVTRVTLQPGGAGTTKDLIKITSGVFGAMNASLWYGCVPESGTTATVVVTYTSTAPAVNNNLISSYLATGAEAAIAASGNQGLTDIDGNPNSLSVSVTIPSGGAAIGVACGATSSTAAKAWGGTGTTEREEVGTGNYCHTTADNTTAGSVSITCQGGANGEDGAIAVVVFAQASGKSMNAQYDWPRPVSVRIRSELNALENPSLDIRTLIPPDTTNLPTGATWGSPKPALRRMDAASWLGSPAQPTVAAQAPFSQTDWALAKRAPARDTSWLNASPSRDPLAPFLPREWPLSKGVAKRDVSWVNSGLQIVTVAGNPFSQTEWPNPKPPRRPNVSFTFSPPYLPYDTTNMPSGASGWDTRQRLRSQQWEPPANILPLTAAPPAASPFSQSDWPLAKRPNRAVNVSYADAGIRMSEEVFPSSGTPFAQYDWPLAKRRRLSNGDWTNGLVPIQYVFRQPLIAPPKPPKPPIGARDFTQFNLSIATTAPQTPEKRNYDWPLAARKPYRGALDWTQSFFPPGGTPFSQTDWPLAKLARKNVERQSWTQQPQIIGIPFLPVDWTNPRSAKRSDSSWTQQPQIVVAAANNPFSQTEWPNAALVKRSTRDWTNNGLTDGGVAVVYPFFQSDWPTPKGIRRADASWTLASPPVDVTRPFGQSADWTNPRGRANANASWSNPGITTAAVADTPVIPNDWTNARARGANANSWTNPGITIPTPMPFNQTEWPNATRVPRKASIEVFGESALLLTPIVVNPFAQTEWPLCARRPMSNADQRLSFFGTPAIVPAPVGVLSQHNLPMIAYMGRMTGR